MVNPHYVFQRLTVKQAAELAQRSTDTIYTALESGALHGTQTMKGGRWSIRPCCIETWMDGGGECDHSVNAVVYVPPATPDP